MTPGYTPAFPVVGREPVWSVAIRLVDAAGRAYLPLTVSGLAHIPRSGPALLATNHVSYLDPVVMLLVAHRAGRKMRGMATDEAFGKPVSGWLLRAGHHIPIRQGQGALVAIRTATAALAAGEVVLIHPEGTIPRDGAAVASAKGGAGLLALTRGVPVIPIATRGVERGGSPWRRRPVTVVIGPPVDLSAYAATRGRSRYEQASETVLAAIRDLERQAAEVGVRR
ncbi:MAG: 1-acyl-sn-glycerol-3-phosphate acyltransferase [Actinomycetota bacterium]|nr:1-acyl-sn-glycerol-3-phosphate acyltransferase [Actinomycetota bacterium]